MKSALYFIGILWLVYLNSVVAIYINLVRVISTHYGDAFGGHILLVHFLCHFI